MSPKLRKPLNMDTLTLGKEDNPINKLHGPHRRWRLAYYAISFTKVLEKVLANNSSILRSLSYVAIDVNPANNDVDSGHDRVSLIKIDQKSLSDMVRSKNIESLTDFGGVKHLALVLETDIDNGLPGRETALTHRRNAFGANKYVKPPAKKFISFVIDVFNDTTIIILLACAILSLIFGIKQHGLKEGWYDGGSIIFAVILVVSVSAFSNFKQSRQFCRLSNESNDIKVEVVRDGRRQHMSIFDIVVGDIVFLKIGDQVPADGLFLDGHSLKVDEASMTGESDNVDINENQNPFLLSGAKVSDGYGCMLVTSVGMNTLWGQMMSSVSQDLVEETPLQVRLNKLTSSIGKVGLSVAILVLAVLLIRYFTGNTKDDNGEKEFNGSKTQANNIINAILRMVTAAVTIVVVAIPEGLPLAVTLTLAYSMKRMMYDNALVRRLSACETMGSATIICTDKTGTLTLNEMKVTEFWIGEQRVQRSTNLEIASNVLEVLLPGIGLNTTGTVYEPTSLSVPEITGSPTEKAILSWGVYDLGMKMDEIKHDYEIIHVETFNSEKKRSGVLIQRKDKTLHTHWKGAAEMILAMCSHFYVHNGEIQAISNHVRARLGSIIEEMAAKSLRCIAFAHGKISESMSGDNKRLKEDGLTLVGIVGLKDPCRPGVRTAVESCKKAGVKIKMITGDNIHTAKAIAIECGILDPNEELDDEAIVEGMRFRSYSPEERMEKVDKICVMARSSPFDKLLMVQCLKEKQHVVAVTGDGTNDAPALKEADIGLSMGIQGTEVAKESSDIVILDDNFTSVVTVLRWGRCVYNNIQKFIQFQLTVNVAALFINFIAAISAGEVPLTAVQLLWVNLIMDTLGALALATEQPTYDLMDKPPVGRSEPLITRIMWRNLIAQALYQITVLLILQFKGDSIFKVDEKVKNTIIFNCFVLCQIFNEFNARKLEAKNIFKGLHKSRLFVGITGGTMVLQVVMVEFLKKFAGTERLGWGQWVACVGIASLSWPIGWLVKCIPVSDKVLAFHGQRAAAA